MAYRPDALARVRARPHDAEPDDAGVEPSAPGWFDSSFDLRRGLDVTELDIAWPDTEPAFRPSSSGMIPIRSEAR